eukprot:4817504-Pyramimonas_sp.AAC.2
MRVYTNATRESTLRVSRLRAERRQHVLTGVSVLASPQKAKGKAGKAAGAPADGAPEQPPECKQHEPRGSSKQHRYIDHTSAQCCTKLAISAIRVVNLVVAGASLDVSSAIWGRVCMSPSCSVGPKLIN